MPNTNDFIRDMADIKATAKDAGVEMTIKVAYYDNGGISVNGKYFTSDTSVTLSASVQIAEALKQLEIEHNKRLKAKAA